MKLLERNYLIIKTQNNVKAIFLPESHLTSGDENDFKMSLLFCSSKLVGTVISHHHLPGSREIMPFDPGILALPTAND